MSGPAVVDIIPFLENPSSPQGIAACKQAAESLRLTSCLIIKDPRLSEDDNNNFLDMMERYYDLPHDKKMRDVHPELSYQLGATPENTEVPRDHHDKIEQLGNNPQNAAHVPKGADPKWRYFWRIGERPRSTSFPELNAPPVIPDGFPQWSDIMDKWGSLMLQAIRTVAEMTAVGLELEPKTFLDILEKGPHLLAPTGSDFGRFKTEGTILAGFHYDLNFLTIHGKSRFPGLYVWLRDGTRVLVRVPDGCLLIQAGKQMEWLTGGALTAGFHEVVVTPETLVAIEKAKAENRSLWRVSSTLFSHIASDKELRPLHHFANAESLAAYAPILAGHQVEEELKQIQLAMK